ncbi:MAG: hypothetical protein A2Y21_10040 [Clostridiales bacterium GWC2_40_7]|nr:MAG: hypothetical protein A2Y21_10040 [Clostridiales bacterium GWC2_40_7]
MAKRECVELRSVQLDTGTERLMLRIPDRLTYEILKPEELAVLPDPERAIRDSVQYPIASPGLARLVKPDMKIALLICDNTRYVPQKMILPIVLDILEQSGVKKENITIVIACGTHEPMDRKEIEVMVGAEIPTTYRIINHNAYDEEQLVYLGRSKGLDVPIYLNKTVVDADFRIGIGVVDPHIFAGYSGGVKILSVGTAGRQSIAETHNARVMEDPGTKFGDIRNNTFRDFLNEVASICKLNFLINVVQNSGKQLLGVFAGDAFKAYEKAVEMAQRSNGATAEKVADIVITVPLYPKTNNLYQAVRAANSVVFCRDKLVKQNGHVILPARCPHGIGSEDFYKDMACAASPKEVIERGRNLGFPPEGNKSFTVSKVLQCCNVIVTDTDLKRETLEAMHLQYEVTVQQALDRLAEDSENRHLIIMPDGFSMMPALVRTEK